MIPSHVRVAERAEVPRVIGVLTEGMREDPVLAWLFPDDASRTRRVERLFSLAVRLYPDAEIFRNDDLTAGAFWVRPGRFHIPVGRQIRMFPATVRALGSMAGLRMSAAIDASHPKEPDHYYLLILATTPGAADRDSAPSSCGPHLSAATRMECRRISSPPTAGTIPSMRGSASRSARRSSLREAARRSGACGVNPADGFRWHLGTGFRRSRNASAGLSAHTYPG